MTDPNGLVQALADGDPVVWQRLLREHVAGDDGRCTRCSVGGGHGRPHWPCRLYELAEAAAARVRHRFPLQMLRPQADPASPQRPAQGD